MSGAAALLTVLGVAQRFDPRTSLFGHFEPGFDYDFSDTTTLFQDTAGTTPVTGVEQTVALILDKSRGLATSTVRSPIDQFTATAAGTTPPTVSGADTFLSQPCVSVTFPVIAAGGFSVSRGDYGGGAANWSGTPGYYRVSYTLAMSRALTTGESIYVYTTGVGGIADFTLTPANGPTTWTTFTLRGFLNATGGQYPVIFANRTDAPITVYLRQYTVERINGLHQIQSTAASRAVLRSRYNLLTFSEQFDNAAWGKVGLGTGSAPTVTPNDAIAPDGTLTADLIAFNRGAGNTIGDQSYIVQTPTLGSATYTQTVWIKAATGGDVGKQLALRNAGGSGYGVVTLTANWVQYSRVETGSSGNWEIANRGTVTADNSVSAHVWGADLRPANDTIYPYQRIAAATDYAVGPQWPTYLEYDGVDDSYASAANLDLSGTDKVTVFAAVTRLSTAEGMLMETSADAGLNNGSFFVYGLPANSDYGFARKGTSSAIRTDTTGLSVPATSVLTYGVDLAAAIEVTAQRVNGAASGSVGTADTGSGNFVSYPLFLGRRNNTNLPFRGRMYRLIGRGAATPVATISQCERFLARQTGITL